MENIFKISKRGIIATLELCILLSIAGTCVNVAAMAEEITLATETTAVATEEITTVVVEETTIPKEEPTVATEEPAGVTEETTQELVPVKARGCSYIHYTVNGYHNNGYVKSVTVTTYYNGSEIDSYTVNYPESGDDAMETFKGCKCPMCS